MKRPNLTDTKARQARARSTPYKLTDQGGLYLYVSATGVKPWRYDYRLHGKWETFTIGKYPDTTLADARDRHADARRQVARLSMMQIIPKPLRNGSNSMAVILAMRLYKCCKEENPMKCDRRDSLVTSS